MCRIAMVGVGFSDMGFVKYAGSIEEMLQLPERMTVLFLRNERMTVEVGAHIAKIFGRPARPLPAEVLSEAIAAFAASHRFLALATGTGDYVRCTPVEYHYADGCFYIVSEGGMKFRSILRNNHVSLAIFENERQPDGLLDVLQVEGSVEILPGNSDIGYREASLYGNQGNDSELFVLCVTPQSYRISSGTFVAAGYDAMQTLDAEQFTLAGLKAQAEETASMEDEAANAADSGAAAATFQTHFRRRSSKTLLLCK